MTGLHKGLKYLANIKGDYIYCDVHAVGNMVFVYKPLQGNHATLDVMCTLQAIWRLFTTVARRPRDSCWAADARTAVAW
jgi:hypothetical protein